MDNSKSIACFKLPDGLDVLSLKLRKYFKFTLLQYGRVGMLAGTLLKCHGPPHAACLFCSFGMHASACDMLREASSKQNQRKTCFVCLQKVLCHFSLITQLCGV